MKKIHEGLKRKVLCSILAAAAIGVSTSAWAATNVIGTVKVGGEETAVTTTSGTFTVGETAKTLSVESKGHAISLYNQNDNGTFLGSDITITSTGSGTVGINAGNTAQSSKPYATVVVGDTSTNNVSVNAKYTAVQALLGHVTLTAKDTVDITSTGDYAVWVQNNTQTATAPEGASSVTISADKVNISGNAGGIVAFSNGQVNITGDTVVDGGKGAAIDVRGNSTVNINADGNHSTVIKGDIIFETPNTEQDSVNSGNIVNASVNLNLSGEGSSWTGSAYQEFKDVDHGVNVSGNNSYYGDVTGLSVSISDGASWNMTENSFVNNATVGADSAINVDKAVTTFNAAEVDLKGGALNAEGGTTTINTLNASDDSTVNLENANLTIGGGTADISEFNASGTSTLALTGKAKVTLESGEAELSSITSSGSSALTVGSEANVKTDEITLDDSSTLTVDSGAVVDSTNGITAKGDSSSVSLASGSSVTGNLYLLSANAQSNSTVAGSFNGTIYKSDTEKLDADAIKKLVGYTQADTKAEKIFDINNSDKNRTVQMSVSDDGTFAIKSYNFSKTSDGQVQTAELGTWDADGNYSANTHNISDVGTLTANKIKLNGTDLETTLTDMSETLDAKANRDMDNLTADGVNQVKDYAQAALEVKNEEGSGVLVRSKEDTENHKTTYTVSLDADTIGTAVGDGKIVSGNTHLVTGGTLYTELRPTAANLQAISATNTTAQNLEALDSGLWELRNMNNLTDAGKGALRTLAQGAVQVEAGTSGNVTVTKDDTSSDDGAWIYKVDVKADGTNEDGNTGLISGGTLYTALLEKANTSLDNLTTDGQNKVKEYAKDAVKVSVGSGLAVEKDTTSTTETGWTVSLNKETIGAAVGGDVSENGTYLVTGGAVYKAIAGREEFIMDEVGLKANLDASNIGNSLKNAEGKDASAEDKTNNLNAWGKALGSTTVTKDSEQLVTSGAVYTAINDSESKIQKAEGINADAWNQALGTGSVADGNTGLVTGGTLYTELRNFTSDAKIVSADKTTAANLEALDTAVYTNQGKISTILQDVSDNTTAITDLKDMKNLTPTGKTAVRKLASEAVTLEGGTNVTIGGGTVGDDGKKTYTVSVTTGDVGEGNATLVTGGTVDKAIKEAIKTSESGTTAALNTKANVDASNIGKNLGRSESDSSETITDAQNQNLDLWGAALGTGTVAATSNQLITGATLYGEVRLASGDYHYVAAANTTADNLKALDDQVYTNTTDIGNLKNLSNISKDAKKVIQSANAIKAGTANDYVTVTQSDPDANGNITTTISVKAEGEVKQGNTGLVTGGTVYQAISDSEKTTNAALATKANLDATNIGSNINDAEKKTANLNAWGAALGTGEVAKGNGQLVTGDTMYNELRPATDGTYVKTNQTTAQNLTALDTQVKKNADNIGKLQNMEGLTETGVKNLKTYAQQAVQIEGDATTGVTVTKGNVDTNGNVTYKVSIDTSTLTDKLDTDKLTQNLGTGNVEKDNAKLVTGGTVYNAIKKELGEGVGGSYIKANATVNANLSALDTAIGKEYGSTNNIKADDDVKTSIGRLDAAIGKVEDLKGIQGLPSSASLTDGDSTTVVDAVLKLDSKMGNLNPEGDYKVISSDLSMANNLEQIDKAFGDVKSLYGDSAIKDKTGTAITEEAFKKSGITGVVQTVDAKIGDLEQDRKYNVIENKNSVNANLGLIDTEIGTTSDGAYVSSKNSIGANLNALDQGLADLDRGVAELNRGFSELGDRVNKVGAGAAALAALHPEGFDPDDKLSFAVGFGHYKNANASAIGAFYKPNEDTTFSVASTVGNGSTMVNAGVSFKLGKSAHVEKTMVAKADYEALQQKVAAQDEKMAAQDAEIEELKKQVALLVAKG